jgi:hypothetical protein
MNDSLAMLDDTHPPSAQLILNFLAGDCGQAAPHALIVHDSRTSRQIL